jgi:hypothetical protein
MKGSELKRLLQICTFQSLIRNWHVILTSCQVVAARGFATDFWRSTMWTGTTPAQYTRRDPALPTGLTDGETNLSH